MEKMVTRTIKTTRVTVIGVDLTANEVVEYEEILPRTYKDEKAMLKMIEKIADSDSTVKPVSIKGYTVEDTLYGMTEKKFIENAKVLSPRTSVDE